MSDTNPTRVPAAEAPHTFALIQRYNVAVESINSADSIDIKEFAGLVDKTFHDVFITMAAIEAGTKTE